MKEYLVTIDFEMKDYGSPAANIRGMKEAFHKAAAKVRPEVEAIINRDGGQMIVDGSGYGIEGHPDQYSMLMLVKVSKKAAKEIEAVKGVGSVNFNGTITI